MKTLLLLSLLILPVCSFAVTGTQAGPFLDDCTSGVTLNVAKNDNSFLCGFVLGVARGVRNTPEVVAAYNENQQAGEILRPYCIPEEISDLQLVRELGNYIAKKPELSHEDVYTLLVRAVVKRFPCP